MAEYYPSSEVLYRHLNAATYYRQEIADFKEEFTAEMEAEGLDPVIMEGSQEDIYIQSLQKEMLKILFAQQN